MNNSSLIFSIKTAKHRSYGKHEFLMKHLKTIQYKYIKTSIK